MKKISNNSTQIKQFQFMRFLAFLLIFLWHSRMYKINIPLPGGNGSAFAVSFFFILSGWLSGMVYNGDYTKLKIKDIIAYMKSKFKIYPLFIFTTIISIMYSNIPYYVATHNFSELCSLVMQLIKNLLLIQSWFPSGYFSFNGVGWFLSSIMFCYVLNLPLKRLINKIKDKYIKMTLLACLFIMIEIIIIYLTKDNNSEFFGYIFPVTRFGEYAAGMMLGYLFGIINKKEKEQSFLIETIVEIIIITIDIYSLYIEYPLWIGRVIARLIPVFLTLIVFSTCNGLISKIFSSKALVYLGNISVGCYLLHLPVINVFYKVSNASNITLLGNYFCLIMCLLITVLFSSIYDKYTKSR